MSDPNTAHVAVISSKLDVSTDAVVHALERNAVRVTRLNAEDFPFDSSLTTAFWAEEKGALIEYTPSHSAPIRLDDISSIWYRRVRSPERPATMNSGVYDFCLRESRSALLGSILAQGKSARLMSDPDKVWAAEHKVYQLATARSVGLTTPSTLISNDPIQIRNAFARFDGQMIAKPVRTGFVDYGHEQHAVYTSQVLEAHIADLESARLSPVIYQPLIPKKCDVRVTIVGESLFVAEIDSQTDPRAIVDWRKTENPNLPHKRASLPRVVENGVWRLLEALGLKFGALDFIRTPDDRWIFLEVNPNGQWLWLDDMLEFGITEAIASWLACGAAR